MPFTVDTVELEFDIHPGKTTVRSILRWKQNNAANDGGEADKMILHGDATSVTLVSIAKNGQTLLADTDYTLSKTGMELQSPLEHGDVTEIVVEIVPENNTQLLGLYKTPDSDMYCTQCEAMGFRRITYFPDRPDNMATFTRVRIEANQAQYPVLLSNGNLVEQGTVGDDRHYVVWGDPFPKPSYLFAAVAGNLGCISDTFVTSPSKKTVQLTLYSEHDNVHQLHHAMTSLKNAMKWDEERFGLEYDLDVFNIVATSFFNMGVRSLFVATSLTRSYDAMSHAVAFCRQWKTNRSISLIPRVCWLIKTLPLMQILSASRGLSGTNIFITGRAIELPAAIGSS